MTPTPRGIYLGLARPIRGVDECDAPSNRLIEEPVKTSDDSKFDDLEDLPRGLDLGLAEELGSLLDYLRTN